MLQATKAMAGVMTSFLQQKKNRDTSHQQSPTQTLPEPRPRGLADAAPPSGVMSHSLRAASSGPEPLSRDPESLKAVSRRPGARTSSSSEESVRLHGQAHGVSHGLSHGLQSHAQPPMPHLGIRSNPVEANRDTVAHDKDLEELLAFTSSQRELLNPSAVANKQRHVPQNNSPKVVNKHDLLALASNKASKHAVAAKRGVLQYGESGDSSEAEEQQHASVTQGQQPTQAVVSDGTHAQAGLMTARHNSNKESPIIARERVEGRRADSREGDLLFTPRQKRGVESECIHLVSPDGVVADEIEVDLLTQSPAKR